MSDLTYLELQYTQQQISIPQAKDNAVRIVKDIFNTVPAALPYLLEPSALLLFSSLRAESPYHQLNSSLDEGKISMLDAVLAKHNIYRYNEPSLANSPDKVEAIFSLINPTVLNAIPGHYGFCKELWIPLDQTKNFRYAYIEWVSITERSLAQMMDEGKLPTEWLQDWWAPHNLRFGMQLGYPGEAISSVLWAEANERSNKNKNNDLKDIIIAIDEEYFGAKVGFYVNVEVISNESVIYVENAWKNIIFQIYKELPLDDFMTNKDFAYSYQRLRLRETGEK